MCQRRFSFNVGLSASENNMIFSLVVFGPDAVLPHVGTALVYPQLCLRLKRRLEFDYRAYGGGFGRGLRFAWGVLSVLE